MPTRAFDLTMATLAAAAALTLLPAIAILCLCHGRPWILRQTRIGWQGRPFIIYKLATMRDGKPTPAGAALRALNLDEIPQIINVFKGDMSFVGPRPLVPEEHQEFKDLVPGFSRRETVKPGICGHYQIACKITGPGAPEERHACEMLDLQTRGSARHLRICLLSALSPITALWLRFRHRHLEKAPPENEPPGWFTTRRIPFIALIPILASPLAMIPDLTSSLIPFVVCFRVAVLLALIAWLLYSRHLAISPALPLIAIWLIATAVAIIASQDPQWSLWHYRRGAGIFDLTLAAVAALLIAAAARTRHDWSILLGVHLTVAAIIGTVALLNFQPPGRAVTLSLPTNILAAYAATALCLGVIPINRRWQSCRRNPGPANIALLTLFALAALICLATVWATGTRAILAPLVIWILIIPWIALGRRRRYVATFATGLSLAAIIAAFGLTSAGDRLLVLGTDPSAWYRIEQAQTAINGWLARPWLGWGPGNYTLLWLAHGADPVATLLDDNVILTHAHNAALQQLAVTGLAGAAPYLLLLGYLAWQGIRIISGRGSAGSWPAIERAAFGGALIILATHLTFHAPSFGTTLIATIIGGLILSQQTHFRLLASRRLPPAFVTASALVCCALVAYGLNAHVIQGAQFFNKSSHRDDHPAMYSLAYQHLVRQAVRNRGDCDGQFLPEPPQYGPDHWLSAAWEGYYFDTVGCAATAKTRYRQFRHEVYHLRVP